VTEGAASANTSLRVTGRPSCAMSSASASRTIRTLLAPASSEFCTIRQPLKAVAGQSLVDQRSPHRLHETDL
jgi:hypothetical protein